MRLNNYFTKPCFHLSFSLIFFLLVLSSTWSFAQVTEAHYRIYSVRQEKEVTLSDIIDDMEQYDVLFFGEEHNDSVAHYLEESILRAMHRRFGSDLTLSLEMFERDVQVVMDEYLDSMIREKNFIKDARAWKNYRDYKPMVELAKAEGLDVICANAPSRYTNLAGRKGQEALADLGRQAQSYFAPLPYDTASGGYYEKLTGLGGHSADSNKDTTKKVAMPAMTMPGFNMIMAQSLWDATMAYSIAAYLKKNKGQKVMQVNGRFHSDEGFAIVTQLENYNDRLKSLVISCGAADEFPNMNWKDYANLGDYIIITDPKVPKTYKD